MVLLAAVCEGGRSADQPKAAPRDLAIFASSDVWDGDAGTTVPRVGLRHDAIYRFDSQVHPVNLPMHGACCLRGVAVSPRDGRVAYHTFGADLPTADERRAVTGVRVVTQDSTEIAWFPDCWSPCWAADGTRLAMIESGPGATSESMAVRVANLTGRSTSFSFRPERIAWGVGDTLFLEYEDRVDGLDVVRGKSWGTDYAGCDVSPDGQYSFRYRGQSTPFELRKSVGGIVGLESCVLQDLGLDGARVLSPFWIRSPSCKHLLCFGTVVGMTGTMVNEGGRISMIDPARSPRAQQGVRTTFFDPGTFKLVHELPGKVVVPSMDHRSVVMLLGDTLSKVRLPEWPTEVARPAIGRVRVQVYVWGDVSDDPKGRLVSDSTYTIAAGDWLPGNGFSSCSDMIRVAGVHEDSRLELDLPLGLVRDTESNGGPNETKLLMGLETVQLHTNSFDGGSYVHLTRVQ